MVEQEYIIENIEDFNLKHIFECGQCFRWNKEKENDYIGVVNKNVIEVIKEEKRIRFIGVFNGNAKEICDDYFCINEEYSLIKSRLSKVDKNLKDSINYGYGIRILHQDFWETLISFIISANNNIPRIKKIIENISRAYGEKIIYNGKEYYTFPTAEELSKASISDLRNLGLGFRDKRIYETTKLVLKGDINLSKLETEKTEELREHLLEIPGVGPKVADCILLFSLKRYEVFPIDVWVKRVMSELYFEKQEDIKNKDITNLANEKFGNLAGIAQQYLFYWRREKEA